MASKYVKMFGLISNQELSQPQGFCSESQSNGGMEWDGERACSSWHSHTLGNIFECYHHFGKYWTVSSKTNICPRNGIICL